MLSITSTSKSGHGWTSKLWTLFGLRIDVKKCSWTDGPNRICTSVQCAVGADPLCSAWVLFQSNLCSIIISLSSRLGDCQKQQVKLIYDSLLLQQLQVIQIWIAVKRIYLNRIQRGQCLRFYTLFIGLISSWLSFNFPHFCLFTVQLQPPPSS